MPSGQRSWGLALLALSQVAARQQPTGPGHAEAQAVTLCEGFDEEWGECSGLQACASCQPLDCEFQEWSEWYDGGGCTGLKFRDRSIKVYNNECGKPCEGPKKMSKQTPLKEGCGVSPGDCVLSEWSDWSECASDNEQAIRTRSVESPPTKGGKPCIGGTKETRGCGEDPQRVDCSLTDWHDWTSCSVTCGVGRKSRMRTVDVEAQRGGKTCENVTLQVASCSATKCPSIDCQLSKWSEWSACDGAHSQRYRHRTAETPPSGDGAPCPVQLAETDGCSPGGPKDCELSGWTAWSDCTKSCAGGQTYRERKLVSPSAHGGNCSEKVLKETSSCNAEACSEVGVPPEGDCRLAEWEEWSLCSASCGEGSRQRKRKIASLAAEGGKGCGAALEEVEPCTEKGCGTADCEWSDWEDWSACSCTCGGGTKRRNRVVTQSPSIGGKLCEPWDKGEVAPCNTQTCEQGCVDGQWGEWMAWSGCSATCSSGFRSRRRDVEVQPNHCGSPVSGLREEFEVCSELPPCVEDKDCELSGWGAWSECTNECFGMRERNRYISTFASGKGEACENETLKLIEPCNPAKGEKPPASCSEQPRTDCELGGWLPWSECSAKCGGGQKERRRNIKTPPKSGGRPCEDDLLVTAACNTQPCQEDECQDCEWSEWTDWTDCTHCGGQRFRRRTIQRLPNDCGKPCEAQSARETENCTSACEDEAYCAWTAWTDATACPSGCGSSTTMRNRAMTLKKGKPIDGDFIFRMFHSTDAKCVGTQLNVSMCPNATSCEAECEPVHCEFAQWSSWSEPTCTGLCDRHRVVSRTNNECGKPCEGPLQETKSCPNECNTPKDCELGSWSDWSECKEEAGQKYRSREVTQQPRNGGAPCAGAVHETAGCNVSAPRDCEFDSWQDWSACSKSCGLGWHTRARVVLGDAAEGGRQCSGSLKELEACNGTACDAGLKKDCELADWGEWSGCNQQGLRERFRKVGQLAANGGGYCAGALHETESCADPPVDCSISDWTGWEECDRQCGGGQTHRQRQIHTFARNGGRACPSDLIETRGCGEQPCQKQDCEASDWAVWGECSTTCGPGVRVRNRTIARTRESGGLGCTLELGETEACQLSEGCGPMDCKWADWSDWDDCTCTCGGGQQGRVRNIDRMPRDGGLPCNASDQEQIQACNTQKCSPECIDGKFGDWEAWGPCTASCGGGTTTRNRKVTRMASECGRQPEGKSMETKFCNADIACEPSVDCMFSDWGAWSDCSTSCNGIKHRARRVERQGRGDGASCVGALKEAWPCNPSPNETMPEDCVQGPPADCELSDWKAWSDCSATCGGGQRTRARTITQHPENGGRGCNTALSQIGECARAECEGPAVKNCEYSDWGDWGACTVCAGQRTRHRDIVQYPENGGDGCKQLDLSEVGECPVKCHGNKTYCTWMAWDDWSTCSLTCGTGGKRHRRRYLHLSAEEGVSMLPPVDTFQEKYERLYVRTQALESAHLRELAVAFGGGCCSLSLMLLVVRSLLSRSRAPAGEPAEEGVGSQDEPDRAPRYQRLQADSDTALPLIASPTRGR